MLLLWLMLRGFAALVLAILDDLLVLVRLKWRAPMGRAIWRWDTTVRCIQCDAPLIACACRPGCSGARCPACEARRR